MASVAIPPSAARHRIQKLITPIRALASGMPIAVADACHA
jgi:hypothetical protein